MRAATGAGDGRHEVVLRGGRVVDGCGNPWYRADVAVSDGRVAAVAPPGTLDGRRSLELGDRYVTPGFVDPHTHSDLSLLLHRDAESAVRQGVTTHVTGNCGMSPAPLRDEHRADARRLWEHYGWDDPRFRWDWESFGDYLGELEAGGLGINVAPLVGHSALRVAAIGVEPRAPSAAELRDMCLLAEEAMRNGALGLSSGLVYSPGCYAETAELIALCSVVAHYGGIYATHVRGERETIVAAVTEALEIGRRAGLPVEVSHNAPKWGAPAEASATLGLVEQARAGGLDATLDNDVHTGLALRLSRALPQPLLDAAAGGLARRLCDPEERRRVRRMVEEDRLPGAGYTGLLRHGAFDRVVVLWAPDRPELSGRSVAELAAERGVDGFTQYFDLIVETDDAVVGIFEYIDLDDIRAILRHPAAMCCSDGLVVAPPEEGYVPGTYWPCSYGEYPGILERFVLGESLLTFEDAIRRMTSFPAQRFGLLDRGVLRPGMRADITVVDLDRVRDLATDPPPHRAPFDHIPPRFPEGIDTVLVNGRLVLEEGALTGELPGLVLRRGGARR